ncbi:MAG: RNA polymerase sigma factor [Acidimicrobiia bacterium]
MEAYEKHAEDLLRYACVLVGPTDGEDVLADAMLKVFTSAQWSKVRDPRGYLFRCVLNQAAGRRRREGLRSTKEQTAQDARAAIGVTLSDELGLLGLLSVRERAVVYLTYWEDLLPADVAQLLGISEGSVRKYLARGRNKLREVLIDE